MCAAAPPDLLVPAAAADFTVTGGVANQTLDIDLCQSDRLLTRRQRQRHGRFRRSTPPRIVTLDTAGTGTFNIGGTITVVAATVDGDYSATVNVDGQLPLIVLSDDLTRKGSPSGGPFFVSAFEVKLTPR